jgi:hypothetical protein
MAMMMIKSTPILRTPMTYPRQIETPRIRTVEKRSPRVVEGKCMPAKKVAAHPPENIWGR